jgi:hypothetical protein
MIFYIVTMEMQAAPINVLGQHCPYCQVKNIYVLMEFLVPMQPNQHRCLHVFMIDGLPCILAFVSPYQSFWYLH